MLAGFLPYLLLREGSVITVHDQLDGEIFTYLFGAEYMFSGRERIAEYMGGVNRAALFPPCFLTVFFYKLLPPLAAFLLNQLITVFAGYLGMYAFLLKLTEKRSVSAACALIFSFLPFYSVYGLSVSGVPMLVYAFWELYEHKHRLRSFCLVLLYGLLSSFVLIGFAVSGLLLVWCAALLLGRGRRKRGEVFAASALLIVYYLAVNRELAAQVLGLGEAQLSQKTEYVLNSIPFWQSFSELFFKGSGHAASLHGWMAVPFAATAAAGALWADRLSGRARRLYRVFVLLYASAAAAAGFYALYHCAPVIALRGRLGGFFVYFQLDRIYWLYPFLWYTMLAAACVLWSALLCGAESGSGRGAFAARFVPAALILAGAAVVLLNSDFKKNVRQLISPQTSNAVTWEKYYGPEVFEQIKRYIGADQSEYRVACAGLNPAAAVFNGFYTVDGYSNNYELSYKRRFREAIAGELEKDEALKAYFDGWGNRCYLFSAQLGQNYYFEKDAGITLEAPAWNLEALKALGCRYILSGVPIQDPESLGLRPEGAFEAEKSDCRYKIWLYGIP